MLLLVVSCPKVNVPFSLKTVWLLVPVGALNLSKVNKCPCPVILRFPKDSTLTCKVVLNVDLVLLVVAVLLKLVVALNLLVRMLPAASLVTSSALTLPTVLKLKLPAMVLKL
jgi:hypothetical protein